MTETDTTLDELEAEKEKVWTGLLATKWDSAEARKFEQQYIGLCRKIRLRKMGLQSSNDTVRGSK